MIRGDNDKLVPYQQNELLHESLMKTDLPVTFNMIEGVGRGFGGRKVDRLVQDLLPKHLKSAL